MRWSCPLTNASLFCVYGSASRRWSICTIELIDVSGLPTSWAMPAARSPKAAIFSWWSTWACASWSSRVRSAMRRQLFPEAELRYSGQTSYRAVVRSGLPPELCSEGQEIWGPGRRFGFSSIGNGEVYWYATLDAPPGLTETTGQATARLRALFAAFPHPGGLDREILEPEEGRTEHRGRFGRRRRRSRLGGQGRVETTGCESQEEKTGELHAKGGRFGANTDSAWRQTAGGHPGAKSGGPTRIRTVNQGIMSPLL